MKALHLLHVIKVGGAQSVAYNYATVLKELGVSSHFCGGNIEIRNMKSSSPDKER